MLHFAKPVCLAAGLFALAACSGPIQTRIDTAILHAPERGATYILAMPEGPPAPLAVEAARLLEGRLSALGLTRTDDAEAAHYAASLSVSDRPADMSYAVDGAPLATSKKRRALQSCKDREIGIKLVLMRVKDAAVAYRGMAEEYHCKAKAVDVMPLLLDSALSGFSGQNGQRIVERQGVE